MNFWMLRILVAFFFWFATFTPSERVALGSAFLVLVGVVEEYVADIESIEARKLLHKRIKRLSMAILVLGLSGDVLGIVMGQAEIAALTSEAGGAAKSARAAHEELNAVKTEARNIKERLDAASAQLGTIEQQVRVQGPRWKLLEAGKDEFINTLKPFAGQRINVVACGGQRSSEQLWLEEHFIGLIGKNGAGWAVDHPGYMEWTACSLMIDSGLEIIWNETADSGVEHASQALASLLKRLSLQTFGHPIAADGKPFFTRFLGADSPEVKAIDDPTAIFMVVWPHPMVGPDKPENSSKKVKAKP
jgi:hypothetical protein